MILPITITEIIFVMILARKAKVIFFQFPILSRNIHDVAIVAAELSIDTE